MGRAARAAIVAASAAALVQVGAACGKEYGSTPDVDAAVDAPPPNPPPADDAAPDASCPVRFLPDEGTYTYSDIFSADKLTIGDSAAPTQAFDSPFFATVTHDAPGCFELTAYLSKGPDGRHVHAWHFCNACDRDAGSLDLVDETDDFTIAMLGATQHSTYTCTRPNPYLVTDVPEGGVIAQAACT
ncbi:MAG TPA: hypothetical protein VIF62_30675, partial [Labilithrix sp.]